MDFEDAKRRLLFSDTSVQLRCLIRLVETIKKKKPKDRPISSDSIQIPELSFLWDVCGSESTTAAAFVTDSLISLIFNKCLEFDYAVNKFVSIASTSKNSVSSIVALSNLLQHKVASESCLPSIHYSVKYPIHPFIYILENKPDVWPVILQCIFQSVEQNSNDVKSLAIMEPVMSYVLFKPNLAQELTVLRNMILNKLFILLAHKQTNEVEKYLVEILPYLQVREHSELELVMSIMLYLLQLPLTDVADKPTLNLEMMLLCTLTITNSYIDAGLNPSSPISVIQRICSHFKSVTKCSLIMNANCIILSSMMKKSCLDVLKTLLQICAILLDTYQPPPIVAGMLAVSIIQVGANPKIMSSSPLEKDRRLISTLLLKLESCMTLPNKSITETDAICSGVEMKYFEVFHSTTSHALLCARFVNNLVKCSLDEIVQWLCYSENVITSGGKFTDQHFSLVTALFLTVSHELCLQRCLELIEVMCKQKPYLSTSMLGIILYKQSLETNPEVIQMIMEYLPKTALHKYAAGPVLNILQIMSSRQELKPQAIYLMLLLWKSQERCFPHFQKLLVDDNESISSDTGVNEIRCTQAFAIKEICHIFPEKYGVQFLGALSSIINKSSADVGTPSILLSLDAISHLCKSEALDIRSTWKTLAPKLTKDKRPSVGASVCRFLSLVPQLKVGSFQYDKFMNESAAYLWRVLSMPTSTPAVVGEALKALAEFPISSYCLKDLPAHAKVNLKLPASMMSTPYDAARNPEDVLTYIPGYCFIDFLKNVKSPPILEGYQYLLSSIVKQEIDELPRGVYVQRKTVGKKHNATDVLSNIPGILCQQYEARKSSGDRKNIAVGILLSYEPPVTLDREGIPVKQSIAMHYKLYEQILGILLNDVDLSCNDWQRCFLLPRAWGMFMERAFFSSEESRRCELELHRAQKKLNCSDEEFTHLLDTSWLWVRERFISIMKQNCVNSFAATANSVLALAGLVGSLEKFYAGLDDKTKATATSSEHILDHEAFQLQCVETLLVALDSNYRSSSVIMGWLLSPSSKQSSSKRSLIKGCSGASLCNLQSVIVRCFKDKVGYLCKLLLKNMSDESPALSLYSGIGLGLFLQCLCLAGYADFSNEGMTVLDFVEKIGRMCTSEDAKCGYFVALTVVVSALSLKGNSSGHDYIAKICGAFYERLQNESSDSMTYEYLSICTCSMMISATASNIIPRQNVQDLSAWLQEKVTTSPQCSSSAMCLGLVLDALVQLNDVKMEGILDEMKRTWQKTLSSEKEPTLQRISAFNGLCSVFSSGRGFIKLQSNSSATPRIYGLKDFVQLMMDLMNRTRDSSIQNLCYWELGRLYSVNYKDQNDTDIVPTSYSFLGGRSTLKPLVQFICDEHENCESGQLLVALQVLSFKFKRPLPPLNWATVLTPVLQKRNDKLTETSLDIALHQMTTSTNALGLIASYCMEPLLHTLPDNCVALLLKNIALLAPLLPPTDVKALIEETVFRDAENRKHFERRSVIAIEALIESYKTLSSNKAVIDVLDDTFLRLLQILAKDMTSFLSNLPLLCTVFSHMSPESENIILGHLEKQNFLHHIFFIVCHMIQQGNKPIRNLRPYLKLAKHSQQEEQRKIIVTLLKCFSKGSFTSESEINSTEKCASFLMENIGWIKLAIDSNSESTKETIPFLFNVCLAILIGSSGYEVSYALWNENDLDLDCKSLLEILPAALFILIAEPVWDSSVEKIIDWLLLMKMSNELLSVEKYYIQSALCALRTSKSFRNLSVWTDIICRPKIGIQ